MEFNWLVVQRKQNLLVKDFEGQFFTVNGVDLSFLPDNVLEIQFSSNPENRSFIKKRLESGEEIETEMTSISEVPNLPEIEEIFLTALQNQIQPPPTNEDLIAWVREARNGLLRESDIIVLKSYEEGVPVPASWVNYRQQLRDLMEGLTNGTIAMPTITTGGTTYQPTYEINFSSFPVVPS